MKVTTTVADPIEVLSVPAVGGLSGAKAAFERLERSFPNLRGRRFYGVYGDGVYRACVAMQDGDDAGSLGLDEAVLPGGHYARTKLEDWPSRLPEIGATFDRLAARFTNDPARPSIEFYRSQKELILLFPIVTVPED